ncbi:VCBS repeat-containing protein [Flavivirga spongiicola]|uniref:VCBS repeat-containing protein n=1 Tax=Flavivirga spongiicola TaxID=421621 RepID=A0ABU7XQP3_9FLAO|nr:VCBS repeat-containing protein [Flavivirga sp. MEBiC05379]MDO5977876.1 VCBS repeat-containing protein [Flavivirga sp. MEBiC05379]
MPSKKEKLFTVLKANETGINFKNTIPESAEMNSMTYEYYYNGGGVSVGDVNKDGLPDLFFTGNVTHNKLYLNLGNFKFKDITKEAGITDSPSWTTGTTMVDINNDGILDIYVCRSGKLPEPQRANLFFISKGLSSNNTPVYKESASQLGLADTGYGTQAIFLDFDKDNDLDMFLLNHNVNIKPYFNLDKIRNTRDAHVGDKLFLNDHGKFVDVSEKAGIISNELGYGLGVSAGDLNQDGWVDLYIANDYSEHDFLYINQQDGTFKEMTKTSFGHQSNFSMGTDIADVNNDGLMDIAVLDMISEDNYGKKTSMSSMNEELFYTHIKNGFHYQYMHNTLQLNRGGLHFSEIGQYSGMSNTDWSWAPLFLDIDLDGFQDLFITNGLKRDFRNNDFRNYKKTVIEKAEKEKDINKKALIENLVNLTPQKQLVNYVFKGKDGLKFENKVSEWGIDIKSFSNGLAYGDFNNDGALDLVVNNIDEAPFIYKNNSAKQNLGNYIKIVLKGAEKNVSGIGSQIKIYTKGQFQTKEMYTTRGYQSSVEPIIHFGLGDITSIDSLEVTWSNSKKQKLYNVPSNQTLLVEYKNAAIYNDNLVLNYNQFSNNKASETGLDFLHKENNFNDFSREVLLPHRMSRLGPHMSVGYINDDKLEDVFIGGASGQSGALFIQTKEGKFVKSYQQALKNDKKHEDIGTLLFDVDGDGDEDLYVVSGGNEFENENSSYFDRIYINNKGVLAKSIKIKASNLSGSRIKAYDFDSDDDLDIIVTGRQYPGKYPFPVTSKILRNEHGVFKDVTQEIAPELVNIGMITDCSWSDYDNDGDSDLVLVGEWTELLFFENNNGIFKRDLAVKGLEFSTGWWHAIESTDFDGDGDMDYVIGNNGLNYKYKASVEEPFQIYSSDFDNNGTVDIVLGYYENGDLYPLRGRECSSQQIPGIKEKFPSYHQYASANLSDVYGQANLEKALKYSANNFASVYVENKGNKHFKIKPLSAEAQFSSVNSIIVFDFNIDGNLDILLGGNNYQSEVETTRNDASMGTILLGNGNGGFSALSNISTGLYLDGDLRDMKLISLGNGEKGLLSVYNDDKLKFHQINF